MQKDCKKYAKSIQKVCKIYVNIMQKKSKNYAKTTQKIMRKGYRHALHTYIYIEYARHGEIQGCSLAFGNWHFWHLALLAPAIYGTFDTFG